MSSVKLPWDPFPGEQAPAPEPSPEATIAAAHLVSSLLPPGSLVQESFEAMAREAGGEQS